MSMTECIIVMSLVPYQISHIRDLQPLSITFGSPNGNERMIPVPMWVPVPPPKANATQVLPVQVTDYLRCTLGHDLNGQSSITLSQQFSQMNPARAATCS
jgi:hypothetical protein